MQQKVNHQGVRVQASIRLTDGSILNGTVNCGITGRLETVLNAQDSFIEFISKAGQQRFISRHQIASVEPLDTMREPHLPQVKEDDEPYMVLGLRRGSDAEAIRHAFERLSDAYADEKWAGSDIPPEITKYAADKLRQINAAYTVLRGQFAKPAPAAPAQPEQPHRPLFGQPAAPATPQSHVDAPSMAPAAPVPPRPAVAPAAQAQPAPERPALAERRPLERPQTGQTGDAERQATPDRPLAAFINR